MSKSKMILLKNELEKNKNYGNSKEFLVGFEDCLGFSEIIIQALEAELNSVYAALDNMTRYATLINENKKLKEDSNELSWLKNPDRMGQ